MSNKPELLMQLNAVRSRPEAARPSLLSFFLFDERGSHQAVQSFVDADYNWLDSLARSSNIVLFFFREARSSDSTGSADVMVVDGANKSSNPSLDVATKFGITPDRLPGIVFFRELDFQSQDSAEGIYWPIPSAIFEQDRDILEHNIARLFTLLQEARSNSEDTNSMFTELERRLASMNAAENNDHLIALLGKGILQVVRYPGKLLESMVVALGKGYGEGLAAKYS